MNMSNNHDKNLVKLVNDLRKEMPREVNIIIEALARRDEFKYGELGYFTENGYDLDWYLQNVADDKDLRIIINFTRRYNGTV